MNDENYNISYEELTDLNADSEIDIIVGTRKFTFSPITLSIFAEYENLENREGILSRAFLLNKCLITPSLSKEQLLKEPIGLITVLFNYLMEASFLMPPASKE